MKKSLYHSPTMCGDVFWNLDNNFIYYIHENDATWRNEYFSKIIDFFDGKIIRWEDKLPKQVIDYIEMYDDYDIKDED